MNNLIILGIAFNFITLFGFYLASLYGRKTKQFRWREYIAIIILPIMSTLAFAYFIDIRILKLFIICSFVGLFWEYILGLAYHKTLNKRLWTYDRLSIRGYTSLLSIPLWGIAGVIGWFLIKMIGL